MNQPQIKEPWRIGVILSQETDVPALRFLILHLNKIQNTFEYEILPGSRSQEMQTILGMKGPVDRTPYMEEIKLRIYNFRRDNEKLARNFDLSDDFPQKCIFVTNIAFKDEFYVTTRLAEEGVIFISLGHWKKKMAPPSVVEFILFLTYTTSLSFVFSHKHPVRHLGTKSCIWDFTPDLSDARYHVLDGYVCANCRNAFDSDPEKYILQEIDLVLGKRWFGRPDNPRSVAALTKKLGYDLFITKSLNPTLIENFIDKIKYQSPLYIFSLIQGVLLSIILVFLGLDA